METKRKRPLLGFDWALRKLLRDPAHYDIWEGFLASLLRQDIRILYLLSSALAIKLLFILAEPVFPMEYVRREAIMLTGIIEQSRYPKLTLPLVAPGKRTDLKFLVDTGFD